MLILSIFLIGLTLIEQSIGIYCPTGCTCVQKAVRCLRIHLKAVPSVPSNTAILDLRYNQINEIPAKAFVGLKDLHTIFLSENQIELIHSDAFYDLNSVKYLYLNNNRISKISDNAFQGLDKLKNLYLENNEIWEFGSRTFSNLAELTTLFLSKNKITEIPENSFNNLPQLRRLRLDNNPIECNCGFYSFFKNLQQNRNQTNVALVCSSPQNLSGKLFEELKDEDFHCKIPTIIEESSKSNIEISTGESIELPCKAEGDPTPEIYWMQDSKEISSPKPHMEILDNGTLKIKEATSENVGVYECKAKNSNGEVKSRPVRMIINPDDRNRRPDPRQTVNRFERPRFISTMPANIVVGVRETIILHCYTTGYPLPLVRWSYNGRPLTQSTQLQRIYSNGTLVIHSATIADAGQYRCDANNNLGTIIQNIRVDVNANLNGTNNTASELPEIILAPLSQIVKTGAKLILECDADGDPQPLISWKINNTIINLNSDNNVHNIAFSRIELQNENTELHIDGVKETDAGRYTCMAENDNGVTEAAADITVEKSAGPPKILFGPYDIEALPGVTIEIPCKSNVEPAPQIRWRKDGRSVFEIENKIQISLAGSLFVKNANVIDSGRYECSVSNEYGRDTGSGLVTVKSNEILAPGDRFVRISFEEASKEVDLAINNTISSLFNKTKANGQNHGDLFKIFRFPNAATRQLARAAEIYERTLVNIRRRIDEGGNLTVESQDYEFKDVISREHLHLIAELSGCMEHRQFPNCTDMCYHSKYRNIDGTCNNLINPTWGSSLSGFRRIAKPIYENGFSMPIGWTKGLLYNGFEIPSARLLSTKLITTKEITSDDRITHMVMQWGQFLDHDLDHAIPSVSSESWDGVDCKKTCEMAAPCYPIEVPENDPRVQNRRCIDLVRSSAICGSGMTSIFFDNIQPREQINQLTSFIDASQVYGYSFEFANELRNQTTEDGLLRTGIHFPNQKDMLPFAAPQDGIDCRRNLEEANVNCFVAGDIRVNEQVGLLATHTIWMREHNRLATKLKELNPHWDGDSLYQESRKIVGAQMQHITYKQWLPIILGNEGMKMLGEYRGYDASINPSISNEFATAALRFGHSLINPILHRLDSNYDPIPQGHLQLHKAFFAPWRLVYEGGVDPLMRGMFSVPAKLKMPGQNLNSELTEKLFHNSHAVALDLAAINIQRARDHGIPGYNEYRKLCNMSVAEKFDDLKYEISNVEIRNKLKEIYGHVSNIDIWVGGILEDQVDGGKVGPLFRCLLVEQFRRLRDGDRFYYENPTVFLPQQLQEIKQSNFGRVLCDNGDNITEATDNVFILPNQQGGYKNCTTIPGINLYFWQDCSSCNSLPPLLDSYVPHSYEHLNRKRRSTENVELNEISHDDDLFEMNEERVSGLEEIISSFQKELKKLRKKVKKLEESCRDNKNNGKHRKHCEDSEGNRRLNNEVWNQDECTKCQCKHPEVFCTKEKCQKQLKCINNLEPIKVAGECCPKCPNIFSLEIGI